MIRNKPRGATVYGIDLGKNIFHVVGTDPAGNVVQRVKFRRDTLRAFFERAERAVVGMEACPGSQWLARKLQAMGHTVRIIPARFVKPYVKSHKNDTIDAAAIAEAVTRPTMRFVQVKQPEQVDLQSLHRIRDQMVGSRTRLICQMRAFCLEYGVAIRQGAGLFKSDLPRVIADECNDLTPTMRRLLNELFEDLMRLEKRIAEITREIEALAASDEKARRLMTIPGIGPLGATALLAAAGNASAAIFHRRQTPDVWHQQAREPLSSKALIHGARSCVMHLDRSRDRLGAWIRQLHSRMHVNKVTVALAAKIARIAWVVLNRPGAIYERRDPALA